MIIGGENTPVTESEATVFVVFNRYTSLSGRKMEFLSN
jgi:hypothetical protein